MEIDKPTCKRDYDNIRWYLLHNGVHVFKDGGKWHVEFRENCSELGEDGRCLNYGNRPKICREHGEYDGDIECEFHGESEPHDLYFSTATDFENYLDNRGVDWKWKEK